MTYCIDTSAWLDGWVRDYPQDVFPSLWERMAVWVEEGLLICSEEVYVELEKKDDGIHDWLKDRRKVVVPLDESIQRIASELLEAHPRLVDTHRNRSQADPFVIATAIHLGAVVVTGETKGKLDSPKIPDVCAAREVPCINLLQMLRELNWKA